MQRLFFKNEHPITTHHLLSAFFDPFLTTPTHKSKQKLIAQLTKPQKDSHLHSTMSSHLPTYQTDWDNREFIQNMQYNIMQMATFLNKFDQDVRDRLSRLNHKITDLERQVEYIEVSLQGFEDRKHLPTSP
jgi:IS1 family transposase